MLKFNRRCVWLESGDDDALTLRVDATPPRLGLPRFEAPTGWQDSDGRSVLGPPTQVNQSRLLWARIDGVEYGRWPTAISEHSWAGLKVGAARP